MIEEDLNIEISLDKPVDDLDLNNLDFESKKTTATLHQDQDETMDSTHMQQAQQEYASPNKKLVEDDLTADD